MIEYGPASVVRRGGRLLLALALAVGWQLTPSAVEEVEAADCVTFYCATVTILADGTGSSGFISSNPWGLECEMPGGSGVCSYVFSWSRSDTDGILVDIVMDPGLHSYACLNPYSCGGYEQRLTWTTRLNPGEDHGYVARFWLANKTRVSIDSSGNSAGRTTSSPAGLNCHWDGSVETGTCEADLWWVGASLHVDFTSTPDNATTFACSTETSCSQPGVARTGGVTTSSATYMRGSSFWVVKPTTVAIDGPGTIVSSPAGISCPPTCSKWFTPLTVLTLTATPGSGAILVDWKLDCADVPISSMECKIGVGPLAAQVGAQFQGPATQPPPPTPRPTATPRPTVKPTAKPTSPLGPTIPPQPTTPLPAATSDVPGAAHSGGTLPSADPGGATPGTTAVAYASGEPAASPADPAASGGLAPTAVVGSPGPGPVGLVDPGTPTSPDSLLLLLVLLLALALGLVVGGVLVYWLVRHRASRKPITGRFSGGNEDA